MIDMIDIINFKTRQSTTLCFVAMATHRNMTIRPELQPLSARPADTKKLTLKF
jgi:hypothetical protein